MNIFYTCTVICTPDGFLQLLLLIFTFIVKSVYGDMRSSGHLWETDTTSYYHHSKEKEKKLLLTITITGKIYREMTSDSVAGIGQLQISIWITLPLITACYFLDHFTVANFPVVYPSSSLSAWLYFSFLSCCSVRSNWQGSSVLRILLYVQIHFFTMVSRIRCT